MLREGARPALGGRRAPRPAPGVALPEGLTVSVLGRVARGVHPGLRKVHAQVARYAAEWESANGVALAGAGPLWVVLGDSTAQGIGAPSRAEGYVGQLRRALDDGSERAWRVLNLSRSGARAIDVVDRQLPALEALSPAADLVTCAIGANDIVRRTPEPVLEARLRRILARLPSLSSTVSSAARNPFSVNSEPVGLDDDSSREPSADPIAGNSFDPSSPPIAPFSSRPATTAPGIAIRAATITVHGGLEALTVRER